MKNDKLELLQQWHSTMVLMNIEVDAITTDWYSGDDENDFMECLEQYESYLERLKNGDRILRAVMMTSEMEVSYHDILDYSEYLDKERERKEEEERKLRVTTSPFMKSLETHAFEIVESKQYPSHQHFKFKDNTGLEISGRVFSTSWRSRRFWLFWKDASGKKQSRKIDVDSFAHSKILEYPASAPKDWVNRYSASMSHLPYIIAHRVINKAMPKGFVYPKA